MAEVSAISLYMSHLTKYHVLLCHSYKHCISPSSDDFKRHFVKHHKHISLTICHAIINFGNSLQLLEPENIDLSEEEIEEIDGLEVSSGLHCQGRSREEDCHHYCITERSMKTHCKEEHGWVKSNGCGK